MKYFIANWKANKTLPESIEWMKTFLLSYERSPKKQIVVCPPLPFIIPLSQMIAEVSGIALGAQDLSAYEQGTYTGEVSARMLSGLVSFTIINHSERIVHFHESATMSFQKSKLAHKFGITRFYCVRGIEETFPEDVEFVCYEPVETISSGDGYGNGKSVEEILTVKTNLLLSQKTQFLYGGSVNEKTVHSYLSTKEIDGLLIGGASLDPERFSRIVNSYSE